MVRSIHFHCINTTKTDLAAKAALASRGYAMHSPLYQKQPVQCAAFFYEGNETVPSPLIWGL